MAAKATVSAKERKATMSRSREERICYLAGLYKAGKSRYDIYKIMIARYGIAASTVRSDIKTLGTQVGRYMGGSEAIEVEIGAAVERLKERAQREDAIGNRADELLLNVMGMRAIKPLQDNLRVREVRLKDAQARLAEAKAEMAQAQLDRIRNIDETGGWRTKFNGALDRVKDSGTVSLTDILEMLAAFLEASQTTGVADNRSVLSMLRMLLKVAIIDPQGSSPDLALISIPEGMRIPAPVADDGDELMD